MFIEHGQVHFVYGLAELVMRVSLILLVGVVRFVGLVGDVRIIGLASLMRLVRPVKLSFLAMLVSHFLSISNIF